MLKFTQYSFIQKYCIIFCRFVFLTEIKKGRSLILTTPPVYASEKTFIHFYNFFTAK
jgi:hypothetical protein